MIPTGIGACIVPIFEATFTALKRDSHELFRRYVQRLAAPDCRDKGTAQRNLAPQTNRTIEFSA